MKAALIVDDCPVSLFLARHLFRKLGVEADVAQNAATGLEHARRGSYGLILLDVVLPDLDGFEVCRRIRAMPGASQPRVVLVTALGENFDRSLAKDVGADDVLFKPIVPSHLGRIVRDYCVEGPVPEGQSVERGRT